MNRRIIAGILILFLLLTGCVMYAGWEYYSLPLIERPRSPLHSLLKPGGSVGHGMGILAGILALLAFMYTVRKNWKRMKGFGKTAGWFQFHIVMGISAVALVTVHSAFKFNGLLALTSYVSMVSLAVTGFAGLFLYTLINRPAPARTFTPEGVAGERAAIEKELREAHGLGEGEIASLLCGLRTRTPGGANGFLTLMGWAYNDAVNVIKSAILRMRLRGYKRLSGSDRKCILGLVRRNLMLERGMTGYKPAGTLFGGWHRIHKIIAYTMLATMLIHTLVTVLLGYTWIF